MNRFGLLRHYNLLSYILVTVFSVENQGKYVKNQGQYVFPLLRPNFFLSFC